MNKDTMKAYPAITTICKDSGCSKITVLKTIDAIQAKGYITKQSRLGYRGNIYIFSDEKSFEPFGYEFLDNEKLSKSEKLQILCTQQYMYKANGVGKITYSDKQLEELTGLNRETLSKNNRSLMKKGLMTEITLCGHDKETGFSDRERVYHLDQFGQAVVFAINNHEERINKTEADINDLKAMIEKLTEENRKQSQDYRLALLEINKHKCTPTQVEEVFTF